jgi:hypothetical protein
LVNIQYKPGGSGNQHQPEHLLPGREAITVAQLDLAVIVDKTDRAKPHGDQQGHPDIDIAQVGP